MKLPPLSDLKKNKDICVLGAGFMGCTIATIYRYYGYRVILCDSSEAALDSFVSRATSIAQFMCQSDQEARLLLEGIKTTTDLHEAVANAFLVHEVVQEDLKLKQDIFGQLDQMVSKDVVLATNTSSYLLKDIAVDCTLKSRIIGIHYVSPAQIIKAVEIIYSDDTDTNLIPWAKDFLTSIEHVGIVCKERPGFIVNRLQFALLVESYKLIQEGFTDAESIDTAVRLSLGPRLALWGPLMTEDLVVNKSTVLSSLKYLKKSDGFKEHENEVPESLEQCVQSGALGALVGRGWYKWPKPYSEIVANRDKQLTSLLSWLEKNNFLADLGAKSNT